MNSSNFSCYALAVCAFASVLTACSSGGPQVTPLGSMQQPAAPLDMEKIQSTVVASLAHGAHRVAPDAIIYTPAKVTIKNSQYNLDLNNNGRTDFTITETNKGGPGCLGHVNYSGALSVTNSQSGGGVEIDSHKYASALTSGSPIGQAQRFIGYTPLTMAYLDDSWGYFYHRCSHLVIKEGNWYNATAYLGLAFPIRGQIHYGWAKLSVSTCCGHAVWLTANLTGYAYQTIAGKSIKAGQL